VAHTGENRNAYRVLIGKNDGNRHLEDLGIDRRILKGMLQKQRRVPWTGFILHWIGTNHRLLQTVFARASYLHEWNRTTYMQQFIRQTQQYPK